MKRHASSVYRRVSVCWFGLEFDRRLAPDERQVRVAFAPDPARRHVVGVRQAEVDVEALPRGQELRLVTEVPLPETAGRVARILEQFGDRDLARIQAVRVLGEDDGLVEPDALGVTAGEQSGARRRAHRGRGVEIGEAHTLGGEAIEVRCLEAGRAETADVAISLVIGEDDDDVRSLVRQTVKAMRQGQAPAAAADDGSERGGGKMDGCTAIHVGFPGIVSAGERGARENA
jgi:hypothetical protein